MSVLSAVAERLAAFPNLTVALDAPLSAYTRFRLGGPASVLCDTADPEAFISALGVVKQFAVPRMVIGGGTNLIVSDSGFDGVVLRFNGATITHKGLMLTVDAGAILQAVVDFSI